MYNLRIRIPNSITLDIYTVPKKGTIFTLTSNFPTLTRSYALEKTPKTK